MHARLSRLLVCCFAAALGFFQPAFATELDDAVRAGNVDRVELLLHSGADPNKRSPYDGPLHLAARLGSPEIVAKLIDAGADVDLAGYGGSRPLHAAVLAGQARTAAVLLERGADVNARSTEGLTALDYAKRYVPNNGLLQHLLIKAGAK